MNKTEVIRIEKIPESVEDVKSIFEEFKDSPFKVAALSVAVLCNWTKEKSTTIDMMNIIKGPRPLSNLDIQFIDDRLIGKEYVIKSYFNGTNPENSYTLPSAPYEIEVSDNPYSYNNEGYATLYLKSSGADSLRPITLRKKESTGEWFLWEHTFLSDIRIPKSQDEWA